MSKPKPAPAVVDEGLEAIADLEARIVRAHDERATLGGAPADEIARQRPAVVALATAVCNQLRAEYRARQG